MKYIFTSLSVLAFFIFFTSSAHATSLADLEVRDYQNSGDAFITYDASTELEWLDLTLTQDMSIVSIEASSYFGEFRWATVDEIETLFAHVFPPTVMESSDIGVVGDVASLIAAVGVTWTDNASIIMSDGFYAYYDTNGDVNNYGSASLYAQNNPPYAYWDNGIYPGNPNFPSEITGAWLVKNVNSVPEPSVLVLIGLGLIGFCVSRRKLKCS